MLVSRFLENLSKRLGLLRSVFRGEPVRGHGLDCLKNRGPSSPRAVASATANRVVREHVQSASRPGDDVIPDQILGRPAVDAEWMSCNRQLRQALVLSVVAASSRLAPPALVLPLAVPALSPPWIGKVTAAGWAEANEHR